MNPARPDTPPPAADSEQRNDRTPLQPFDVFRPAGTDRLAGQRFPGQVPLARPRRDGLVDQRVLADAQVPDTANTMHAAPLRAGPSGAMPDTEDRPSRPPAAAPAADCTAPSPTLLRVQTLQLNMQQRIAALRAEQAEAFERLRAWEDDGREQAERLAQPKPDTPDA